MTKHEAKQLCEDEYRKATCSRDIEIRVALVPTWLQEFEKEAGYMTKQEEIFCRATNRGKG